MAAYARQAKDSELIQYATEIKVRAERRCGELLRVTAERGERATQSVHGRGVQASVEASDARPPTLSDMGLTRDESSRYQQLAAMPAEHFETAVATAKARGVHIPRRRHGSMAPPSLQSPQMEASESCVIRQTPPQAAGASGTAATSASQSARPRRLLSLEEVRQKLGVSGRTAKRIVGEAWFPLPIELGPRCIRYVESEVDEALAARAPRRTEREEPAQLLRGKVEKLKAAGAAA